MATKHLLLQSIFINSVLQLDFSSTVLPFETPALFQKYRETEEKDITPPK